MPIEAPDLAKALGDPIPRVDGRLKVTGGARYPADEPVAYPLFAALKTSSIAKGRIVSINESRARAVPGVLDILTYKNASQIKPMKTFAKGGHGGTSIAPLASEKIWHDGQIVALVVAETIEAAEEGVERLDVAYQEETPTATFDSPGTEVKAAADTDKKHKDPKFGDAEAAFQSAPVKVDGVYETPTQHHNPIELFTTTCVWNNDMLTVYEPSQFVYGFKNGVAEQLDINPDNVRVVSRFVGGGFGSKGAMTPRTAIVALAARRLQRPVKLAASRKQGFTIATYRAETRHHLRLGANNDGKIAAYLHEAWELTYRPDDYNVSGTTSTAVMYDYGSVATKVNVVNADRNTPGFMRSPPEVPYMYALESAMDELAYALNLDPVELRKRNDTMKDPATGRPYSSRSLLACIDEGAEAFGWMKRTPQPGSMREGDWLIGWGFATATYPTQIAASAVRVRLTRDGAMRVQVAAHDIGTGAYTVIGQAAAEQFGLDASQITVELGDTALPPGPVAGGSNTTATVSTVVCKACDQIREILARTLTTRNQGPFAGRAADSVRLSGGRVYSGPDSISLEDAFNQTGVSAVEEYAESTPHGLKPDAMAQLYQGHADLTGGPKGEKLAFAFGAQFVEVRVHALTGEIRTPRAVGAFAAGRILNSRTARSQLMGGMIWGISSALHEATEIDEKSARYVNTNLADYLIPVNADVPSVQVVLVPEIDDWVNPMGVKGLGELGNVGLNAAVANAVYHATGRRIRKLPIRLEKLLV